MCKKLKCIFTVQVSLGLCLLLLGIDVIRCHLLTRQRTRWNIIGIDWWILNQRILYKFFQRAQIIVTRSARTIIAIVVNIIKRVLLYISTVSLFVICLQQWRRVRKHRDCKWMFSSPDLLGSLPYWRGAQPAAFAGKCSYRWSKWPSRTSTRRSASLLFHFPPSWTPEHHSGGCSGSNDGNWRFLFAATRRLIKLLFRGRHAKLSSPCP